MKVQVTAGALAIVASIVFTAGFARQGHAQIITVGPGAFQYAYNSQDAGGTGAADPNAVLNNILFTGDGGAPNVPNNFVNFYAVDQFVNGPLDGNSFGDVTYTFAASAGQVFSGDVSIFDRLNIFNFNGNALVQYSTNGGVDFTDVGDLRVSGGDEYETNLINVDGASSFILKYNLLNIRNENQRDQVQLFRQANVGLGSLEQAPFVVSGMTAVAAVEDADFDGDGDVDGADFLTFQRGLGTNPGAAQPADGDANGDMNVDAADLSIFQQQFGTGGSLTASIAAVPEPSTALLLTLGACLVRLNRFRRAEQC
ncbi:MAG: PEP-CTERM sorting domain-containing protein [Pirellulales bacterium]|nr:PEP-CTERM sorting domain-containing protein [Pirellulales bacterium]